MLGYADSLGQLKAGYTADIVAVSEHPEKNVTTLEQVNFVMKEGAVFKEKNKEVLRGY